MSSPGYPEHYPLAPGGQTHPLSIPAAVGHLLTSQGHKKNFTDAKGSLPLQSSLSSIQRNREHSSHATGDLGQYTHTQSTLEHLPCVWEDVESPQSASGSIGSLISPHLSENLGLSVPQRETESSCLSDQGSVGSYLLAKETLKVTNSKQVTQGSSPSAQGTGGHSSSSQAIVGQSMSTKKTLGTLPLTPEPLGSTQNTQVPPGYILCDERPLEISLSTQGTLGSSSSPQKAFGPSLAAQGSLKVSISKQEIVQNVSSFQNTL